MEIYRRAEDGIPYCFLLSFIFFSATFFPLLTSIALTTTPKDPSPSLLINWYFLATSVLSYRGECIKPSCSSACADRGCIYKQILLFRVKKKALQNFIILIMNRQQFHKQTGSHHLIRQHFFNNIQPDVDVPDGDLEFGKKMYNDMCAGCHNHIGGGPSLISIYGMSGANQKAFTKYSDKTKALKGVKWSKERLFQMLECPEQLFGVESAMVFDGIKDPYIRASIIEYIQFMRLTDPLAHKPKEYVYS